MRKQGFRGPGRKVLVLGGGLAGIAAALRLAEVGWHVVLIEARRHLGGRAGSHIDPQSDERLDNCQHVLLGCCTHLIDLYREGKLMLDELVTHRFSLDQINEAFEALQSGQMNRGLILFS